MRYSISRSVNEKNRHLVFVETCFDRLPDSIQRQGPWQHLKSGEFENLQPEYQKALSERGFSSLSSRPTYSMLRSRGHTRDQLIEIERKSKATRRGTARITLAMLIADLPPEHGPQYEVAA